MNLNPIFSPTSLSYVAALRGFKPRLPTESFTYAAVPCASPDHLVGLAASNPEGRFFGLVADQATLKAAEEHAKERAIGNVTFLAAKPSDVLLRLLAQPETLPALHYLVCDETATALPAGERNALCELAQKWLKPGGLFSIGYRTGTDALSALRFLVREAAPEMSIEQASTFLLEIKKLGSLYLKSDRELAAKLDHAIAHNMPDEFFNLFDEGDATSRTFDTLLAMRSRGFAYAGDGQISTNYLSLTVPEAAQTVVEACRDIPLYEPIKDFVLNRTTRYDIWCSDASERTESLADLFGGFSYGITVPRDKVPTSFDAQGKPVALDSALYAKLIDLMTLMPVSIGDVLSHPAGAQLKPLEIVEAVQVLVACGVARPMRGSHKTEDLSNIAQPRLAGSFNQFLDKTTVTASDLELASPVLGDTVTLTPRDALVMQALDRAGLANSVSALLPELERLAGNPGAAKIITVPPTAETARQMIEDVLTESIVQWYAYGLLKAA